MAEWDQSQRALVVGIGGAGGSIAARVAAEGATRLPCITVDTTDAQNGSKSFVLMGKSVTRGFGAGGNPALGARAAEASGEQIREKLAGIKRVYITAGLGGGTGGGASPVVARIATEMGADVIAVALMPFTFEGPGRRETARTSLETLAFQTNHIIAIESDRLGRLLGNTPEMSSAYRMAASYAAWRVLGDILDG